MEPDYSNAMYWDKFFKNQIEKESDRATVIITVSMIDQALEAALRGRFVQLSTSEDPLFDSAYAPLGNFSAKIDLAYRIGLLPPNYAKGLHIIRRIRNEFAHSVSPGSFDEPAIRNRILELNKALGVAAAATARGLKFSGGLRGDFEATASWIIWRMWLTAEKVEAIQAPNEWMPPKPDIGKKEGA